MVRCLAFLLMFISSQSHAALEIKFYNVGQGEATLVSCDNAQGGKNRMLVDLGYHTLSGNKDFENAAATIASIIPIHLTVVELASLASEIKQIIITHSDADHYNYFNSLNKAANGKLKPKPVYISGFDNALYKNSPSTKLFKKLINIYAKNKVLSVIDENGINAPKPKNIDLGCPDTKIFILYAGQSDSPYLSKTKKDPNTGSIVLLIQHKAGSKTWTGVLTGDITGDSKKDKIKLKDNTETFGEEIVINNTKNFIKSPSSDLFNFVDNGVDFLSLPHHGSEHSSTDKFMSFFKPRMIFVSAGLTTSFGHPRCVALERAVGGMNKNEHAGEKRANPHLIWCGKERPKNAKDRIFDTFSKNDYRIFSTAPHISRHVARATGKTRTFEDNGVSWTLTLETDKASVTPSCLAKGVTSETILVPPPQNTKGSILNNSQATVCKIPRIQQLASDPKVNNVRINDTKRVSKKRAREQDDGDYVDNSDAMDIDTDVVKNKSATRPAKRRKLRSTAASIGNQRQDYSQSQVSAFSTSAKPNIFAQ